MKNEGKHSAESLKKTRLIQLDKDKLYFHFLINESEMKNLVLPLGYVFLSNNYFKQSIPTEAETEYAINYIEDELMRNPVFKNQNESLVCRNELLTKVFIKRIGKHGKHNVFSRQEVEELFNSYAYIIMGNATKRIEFNITKEEFSVMLLIREIMHHLDFKEITCLSK